MPYYQSTDTTAEALLLAVEARLHQRVAEFKAANCFICDEPLPPDTYLPQGDVACTIALVDGTFNGPLYVGGGGGQLTEAGSLGVTVLTRCKIDQPPRAKVALLGEKRGILSKFKRELLAALLVDDPAAELLAPWIPANDAGQALLRSALEPRSAQGPRTVNDDWLALTLWFGYEFDWDLRVNG